MGSDQDAPVAVPLEDVIAEMSAADPEFRAGVERTERRLAAAEAERLGLDPVVLLVGRILADRWYSPHDDGAECTEMAQRVVATVAPLIEAAALRAYADRHHPGPEGFAQRVEYGTGVEYDAACTGCGASWCEDEGGCTERAQLLADAEQIEAGATTVATPAVRHATLRTDAGEGEWYTQAVTLLVDLVTKCTEYGTQDGGFVASYLLPTGPVHRAIPFLDALGIPARPGFDPRKGGGS